MRASEIMVELGKRINLYGDLPVMFRDSSGETEDLDIMSVYGDDESERIIMSDFPDRFENDDDSTKMITESEARRLLDEGAERYERQGYKREHAEALAAADLQERYTLNFKEAATNGQT